MGLFNKNKTEEERSEMTMADPDPKPETKKDEKYADLAAELHALKQERQIFDMRMEALVFLLQNQGETAKMSDVKAALAKVKRASLDYREALKKLNKISL